MKKESTWHFLTKSLILLIMVFVAIPCTLKREFKQGLNIPLITWEESDRSTKNVACQSVTGEKLRKNSTSFQLKNVCFKHPQINVIQGFALIEKSAIVHEAPGYKTVPLHILHEQYLI